MARVLKFQQITDSRFMDESKCLSVLEDRIYKITNLLDLEGINVKVGEPRLVDWSGVDGVSPFIQYRVDFRVSKTTRKTTWNDIYDIVNSVKAVRYDFC